MLLTKSWQDVGVLPPNPTLSVANNSPTSITLSWANNDLVDAPTLINGYFVFEFRPGENSPRKHRVEGRNNTTFTISSLTPQTQYFFQVFAANHGGSSLSSNVVSVTTPKLLPPDKPSLTATAAPRRQVNLSWVDAVNETGYVIERANKRAGPFAVIERRPANTATFSHIAPQANTTYFYRLKAINTSGSSPYSNLVQIKSRK